MKMLFHSKSRDLCKIFTEFEGEMTGVNRQDKKTACTRQAVVK